MKNKTSKNLDAAAKKVALFGILGAMSLVLSLFESVLIPDISFLPAGAKPGLSNIVTTFCAYYFGFGGAVYITVLKVLFAFITRGATASFMSFCGGALSTAALCILIKYEGKVFSFVGLSIISAVFHNLGQLIAACVISKTAMLVSYGKYLLLFALASGFLTGLILNIVMPKIKKIMLFKFSANI